MSGFNYDDLGKYIQEIDSSSLLSQKHLLIVLLGKVPYGILALGFSTSLFPTLLQNYASCDQIVLNLKECLGA